MDSGDRELAVCSLCQTVFNNISRRPKILSCYHTYCSWCLENLLQSGSVPCLTCGVFTRCTSVSSLPDNPYLIPVKMNDNNNLPHTKGSSTGQVDASPRSRVEVITDNLESIINKVQIIKEMHGGELWKSNQVLDVLESLSAQFQEKSGSHQRQMTDLAEYEAKLLAFKNNVEKNINPMDIRSVKYAEEKVSKIISNFDHKLAQHGMEFKDNSESELDPRKIIIKHLENNLVLEDNEGNYVENTPVVAGLTVEHVTNQMNTFTLMEEESVKKEEVEGKVESSAQFIETSNNNDGTIKLEGSSSKKVQKVTPFKKTSLNKSVGETNRPRSWMMLQVDSSPAFKVVFELRPDVAPRMVKNFQRLCAGTPDGRGYKGSKIYRAKSDDYVAGGDIENNDGTGGHSSFDERFFLADQSSLGNYKGALRMKGMERTVEGRCKIGSQFMVWVGDMVDKDYKYSLVFGEVIDGLEELAEVSRIRSRMGVSMRWELQKEVTVIDCGNM